MRNAVSGALAASVAMALSGAASAQSTSHYDYNASYGATTTVAPQTVTVVPYNHAPSNNQSPRNYATSTATVPVTTATATPAYAAPATSSYTVPAQTYVQPTTTYAQPSTTYTQQATTTYTTPAVSYTPPATTTYAQPTTSYVNSGTTYAAPPVNYAPPATATTTATYAQPASTYTQPVVSSATTPSYAAQGYPTQATTYGGNSTIYSQPLPAPSYNPPAIVNPVPAKAYTPTTMDPASISRNIDSIPDNDGWSMNLARYYPAIQACLRRSTAKNPVIANVQQNGQQTVMLIGEGGSPDFSTCKTGLTGTTIKASSETRPIPPAFFAPLGSTFTATPDRPFQPVVDTDQKVIGWVVRTRPMQIPFDQYGKTGAPGFDGQFIPPMMVNAAASQG